MAKKDWRDMDGDEIFDTMIAPGMTIPTQVTSPPVQDKSELYAQQRAIFENAYPDKSNRTKAQRANYKSQTAKAKADFNDAHPHQQEQVLRQLRGNHYVKGAGWKPNKATAKQWAKQNQNKSLDGSGSSECFSEFSWEADADDNNNGTLSVTFARNNASYDFADVSREDFFEAIGGSEGGWWNDSGLYGNQI
jgi:hypothetical protein